MSIPCGPRRTRSRARRGQMTVVFALTLTVFIGAMVLGIDISRLRGEAENAQRVANAAALAGVVFLPDFASNAQYRARQEAAKNGFHDGQSGVIVTPQPVSGYPNRLQVTVTEPVSLIFGGVLGLGPRTVSRTAVAEYNLPLQMGSPDNVIGYAPFPTKLVSSSSGGTEGYYLEVRGPYGNQENGDAYSQYFESYNQNILTSNNNNATVCISCTVKYNNGFNPSVSTNYPNPCPDPNPYGCADQAAYTNTTPMTPPLHQNPDRAALNFTGYDYVVEDPFTNTMAIKLFDPYDEGNYNYDVVHSTNIPDGIAPISRTVPGFGAQYMDAYDSNAFGNHTTTTRFSISGPGQTPNDPTMPNIGPPSGSDPTCAHTDCALANNLTPGQYSWDAGDDPTYATCHALTNTAIDSSLSLRAACYDIHPSRYAYRFLNYAIVHGPGFFRIHVSAERNSDTTFGTHGNMFGIGVCQGTTTTAGVTSIVPMGTAADPTANGAGAHTDPTAGGRTGWNPSACLSPNDETDASGNPLCAHPGIEQPGQCVHVFGLGRMCLFNNLANGLSLIPLGYVPAGYGGKTLNVRLYDIGDSSNGDIEVLTPAGDTTHYGTQYNSNGTIAGTTPITNQGFPAALDYNYSVAPTDSTSGATGLGSGYIKIPASTETAGNSLQVSSGSARFNGSWLNLTMTIPSNDGPVGTRYADMVNGVGTVGQPGYVAPFGGYWKMLYQVQGGNDTTTWEISVNGTPVHLVG